MKEGAGVRTLRDGGLAGYILQDSDSGITGSLRLGPDIGDFACHRES